MNTKFLSIGLALVLVGSIGILTFGYFFPRNMGIDAAEGVAGEYLTRFGNPDIAISEIMEFELNYYVVYYEKSTGVGAFEMLIDKSTGNIFPEYGPNMMWNLKYGHGGMMGGWRSTPSTQMPIDVDEARSIAQGYLDGVYAGAEAAEVHQFYGYYTIHVSRDGGLVGMLSVHGYEGLVWYHSWHGEYVQSREID